MAFNAQDILAKAKQEAEEKAKKAEEERLAAIEAEKRRAAQEAEEKARREKEAAEQKERERKEKEEQERKEREEREKKELEEKMRIEAEKARVQEELRQKAEEEIRQKTAATSTEMESVNLKMQNALSNKTVSSSQINKILANAKELLSRNVDYDTISVYQAFKDNVNQMEVLLQQLRDKERKAYNRKQNSKKAVRAVIGVIAVLLLGFGIFKLATRPKPEKPQYVVGKKGQAGIVFYDKGEYSDGWRYLECAFTNCGKRYWADATYANYMKGLKSGLGEGDFNTSSIINGWGEDTAAYVASTYNGGGKTDWYLPNRAEIDLIYKNLHKKDKKLKKKYGWELLTYGIFDDSKWYWTSEMSGKDKVYILDGTRFLGGDIMEKEMYTYVFLGKEYYAKEYIRPIRKF